MILSGASCSRTIAPTATNSDTCKVKYTQIYFNKQDKKIIDEINSNAKYRPVMQKLGRNILTNSNVFK